MKRILEIIEKHSSNKEYHQTLMTILSNISEDDYDSFERILEGAEKNNGRLFINKKSDEMWDSLTIEEIGLSN